MRTIYRVRGDKPTGIRLQPIDIPNQPRKAGIYKLDIQLEQPDGQINSWHHEMKLKIVEPVVRRKKK